MTHCKTKSRAQVQTSELTSEKILYFWILFDVWVQTEHFTGNGCYETFISSKNFRITFLQKKLKTNNLEQGQCLKVSWSFLLIKDPGDKKLLCVTVHNIWLLNRVKQTSGSQVFIPALNSYCSRQKVKQDSFTGTVIHFYMQ